MTTSSERSPRFRTDTVRAVLEQIPTGLFRADLNGVLIDVNRTFARMVGAEAPAELAGRRLQDLCIEPHPCLAAFERLAHDEGVDDVELHLQGGNGHVVTALLNLQRMDGTAAGVTGALRDVTAWKAALDTLTEEAEYFSAIVTSMSQGAVLLDANGSILTANPSAERILGLQPKSMAGRSTHDAEWQTIHEDGSPFPSDMHPVSVSLRTGQRCEGVVMGVRKPDDAVVWLRINSTPLLRPHEERPYAVIATFDDITEQRRIELEYLQAQKLDALGQLAGGIAHDFNNMLMVVFSRCELLLRRLDPLDSNNRKYAADILTAARHSAELTQQLLGAARKQILEPKVLDVVPLIRDTMKLLARSIGEHINVRLILDDGTWRIFADPGKLRQVLMNLVINARDALTAGGTLTIEARNFLADAAYVRRHPRIEHGEYVMVIVSDTGSGIPPEVKPRIFDPFFTTKATGSGTGLGLAVVHGVVEQTGGHIDVYSEVGRGTTFKLFFPRFEKDVERLLAGPAAPSPEQKETILLVEDEELVRTVLRETLEEHGYTVLEAADGKAAYDVAVAHAGEIRLLLTDVMMPGLSGPDLGRRLRFIHPNIRVICMSGYTDKTISDHVTMDPDTSFLEKPVMSTALLTRVREVLDGEV